MFCSLRMSTSPESRTDDRLIALISRWLGRHMGNAELARGIAENGSDGLAPGQAEAVRELAGRLGRAQPGERGGLEMIAREALQALALRGGGQAGAGGEPFPHVSRGPPP